MGPPRGGAAVAAGMPHDKHFHRPIFFCDLAAMVMIQTMAVLVGVLGSLCVVVWLGSAT
jgi:hypothetical protein